MSEAHYSIGIDLGTTNCALSYTPLSADVSQSQILPISQWDSATSLVDDETLPSFLYRPTDAESDQLKSTASGGNWLVGRFARHQTSVNPPRVVSSAKSWLCTPGIDQTNQFLPWGSDQLIEEQKVSPVRASALLLDYMQSCWNDAFADAPFHQQRVTVTVPASFDAAAQKLTLKAAEEAGFKLENVSLLEEPQAAFCRWLETNGGGESLYDTLPNLAKQAQCVLVVDVGGGTSDFSLFEIRQKELSPVPIIKRIAVSDHILLGGDNIDLAMAHVVAEVQLGGNLSPEQWGHLISQCRSIKEETLENPDVERTEPFKLTIPGRGSGLFADTLTAELSQEDVNIILFEGFYPECQADVKTEKSTGGLREFGLPYAKDHAVTRHLAEFLQDRPQVDSVIFNGGSLKPEPIRERLVDMLELWQNGSRPIVLPNKEPALAVARGAASYGWYRNQGSSQIEATSPRSLFLEVKQSETENALVCILPKGTPLDEELSLDTLELNLQVNQHVGFQVLSSNRIEKVRPGEKIDARKYRKDLHTLPPLETIAKAEGKEEIPVTLSSKLNGVGLLQLECVDRQNREQRWPLEFNITGKAHPAALNSRSRAASTSTQSGSKKSRTEVSVARVESAKDQLERMFSRDLSVRNKLTVKRVTQALEKQLALPKHEWDVVLLRKLWDTHAEIFSHCYRSVEHEETWMNFAGFLLRPGYGVQFDEDRIDRLWTPEDSSYDFPCKRIHVARYLLWRRVAGGLNRDRQEKLADECFAKIRDTNKPPAEAIRLIGALERVGLEKKSEICDLLLEKGKAAAKGGQYADPFWVALMSLLNRAPVYSGPETVVPAEKVDDAFSVIKKLDWKAEENFNIANLFLRAARQVDNTTIDLPRKLRKDIINKLKKADVSPARLTPLLEYVEIKADDQVGLIGEPLPPGLVLLEN